MAAGQGHLLEPLRYAQRQVWASDLYPGRADIAVYDFVHGPPPNSTAGAIAITNPPNSKLTEFLVRGLALIDAGYLEGMALLTRLGADTTRARGRGFDGAAFEWRTTRRPYWKPRHVGDRQPRWMAQWTLWLRGDRGPRVTRRVYLDDLNAPRLAL